MLSGALGVPRESIYEKVTNAFILERSSMSTLPFAIDDPSQTPTKGSDLNELIVDLYNKGKSASLRKETTPRSLPLVATNYRLKAEER